MKKLIFLIFAFCLHFRANSGTLVLDFYFQKLEIAYDESILSKKSHTANDQDLMKFYESISKANYQMVLDSMLMYKAKFRLNDWLYYSMVTKICMSLDQRQTNSSYLKWFFLGKSGYRVYVIFSKRDAWVELESSETVSNVAKSAKGYCIDCKLGSTEYVYARFNPFKNNKTKFSFLFDPLPAFINNNYTSKIFQLKLQNSSFKEIKVKFSNALIKSLQDRKNLDLKQTFSVPLSVGTSILLDEIREIIKDDNDSVKVEYITNFVMRNLRYRSDENNFGNEKWLTPEEYLYNESGDCEDRCSFLYYALGKILQKPVVIINYPYVAHVNIGINLDLKSPPNFYHKGKPFYVIEPSAIGSLSIPLGKDESMKKNKFQIID